MARLVAATVFSVTTLSVTGCGDDSGTASLSLGEYYSGLDQGLDELRSTSGAAFATLGESSDVVELKSAFAELPRSLREFLDTMAGYEPPSEVEDAHASALTAGRSYLSLLEDIDGAVQETTSLDAFVATAGNDELQQLVEEFNARCEPLQRIADDEGVQVDLECPSE